MIGLSLPARLLAWLLVLLALAGGSWWAVHRADARGYARAVTDGQAVLLKQTQRVLQAERQLNDARATQEKTDAQHLKTIAGLRQDLAAMSRAGGGGGLRDPNAVACPAAPAAAAASAGPGGPDPAQASGLLSRPLESLLLELTAEADTINAAYASCRADAQAVRARGP